MKRYFEKISFAQFKKDICDNLDIYNEYKLPERKTENSAGYDFLAIEGFSLKPGEVKKIPTGYKVKMQSDEMLMIVVRGSMGFKYNVRMTTQVGIVDSDYYNNDDNEGHMWVMLQNHGEKDYKVNKGDAYAQGIFVNFLTCGEKVDVKRKGGFGSSDRKSENNE